MPADQLIVGAVVLVRVLVPLTILRYPLPGMVVAALLIDADRDVYLHFLDITEPQYQRFDKAMDTYYATFAFLAMRRNWTAPLAVRIGSAFFFYRLAGVALFELSGQRWVLAFFPNAFDFFFIAYEALRLRWRPERLLRRQWLGLAAIILVANAAKEFWVHVLLIDVSDTVIEQVSGAPWLIAALVPLAALLIVAARLARRHLPPPDPGRLGAGGALRLLLVHRARPPAAMTPSLLLERSGLLLIVAFVFAQGLVPWLAVALFAVVLGASLIGIHRETTAWLERHHLIAPSRSPAPAGEEVDHRLGGRARGSDGP